MANGDRETLAEKLSGDGLIQSASLLVTRLLTWVGSLLAAIIAGINAAVGDTGTSAQGQSSSVAPTSWLGFTQGQTVAIIIALIGMVAITATADVIGRAWVTASSTDSVFLGTPWPCFVDRTPDIDGALIGFRAKDNKALFVPDGGTNFEWVDLSEVKGRR